MSAAMTVGRLRELLAHADRDLEVVIHADDVSGQCVVADLKSVATESTCDGPVVIRLSADDTGDDPQ